MLAYLFIAIAVAFRFVHHPLAFTPVGAALLYFGTRQPRSRMWIAVLAMIGSDLVLTPYVYGYALTADHLVTWAWYAGIVLLGSTLRESTSPLRIAGAALGTAVSFFIVSNFAVWAVWRSMYPATVSGLLACYTAALPFFRNEVAADVIFTALFFGVGALVAQRRATQQHLAA